MQLPLSFHLTAIMLALVCGVNAALAASTAFIPPRRSLGSTVDGICRMRRAGWWRCQGLFGWTGVCVCSMGVGFGFGLMVGPVAKTSLDLAGFTVEGVEVGVARFSSSTSLASLWIADRMSSDGFFSSDGLVLLNLRCSSRMSMRVLSG